VCVCYEIALRLAAKKTPLQKKAPLQMTEHGVCETCGESFLRNSRGRPRKFCPNCSSRREASRRWWNENRRKEPETRRCVECGQEFMTSIPQQLYCKVKCRWKANRGRRSEESRARKRKADRERARAKAGADGLRRKGTARAGRS
jgi:hypothetical protein